MPDGLFNGVEVLWIAGVILMACLTLYASRRWDRVLADRRAARERAHRERDPDTILASTFEGDLAWPTRRTG